MQGEETPDPSYLVLIERLLTVYNVARHAVVECGACSSDVSDVTRDCPYAGLTARLRVVFWMWMMTFALVVKRCARLTFREVSEATKAVGQRELKNSEWSCHQPLTGLGMP